MILTNERDVKHSRSATSNSLFGIFVVLAICIAVIYFLGIEFFGSQGGVRLTLSAVAALALAAGIARRAGKRQTRITIETNAAGIKITKGAEEIAYVWSDIRGFQVRGKRKYGSNDELEIVTECRKEGDKLSSAIASDIVPSMSMGVYKMCSMLNEEMLKYRGKRPDPSLDPGFSI